MENYIFESDLSLKKKHHHHHHCSPCSSSPSTDPANPSPDPADPDDLNHDPDVVPTPGPVLRLKKRLPYKYLYIDGDDYVTISSSTFSDTSTFTIATNKVYSDMDKTNQVGTMYLKLMQVYQGPNKYMLNLTNTTHIDHTDTIPDHIIEMRSFQEKLTDDHTHVVHGWDFITLAKVNDGASLTKWAPVNITMPLGSTIRRFKFKKFITDAVKNEPAEVFFS
jgi:hypothetical protein